MNPRSSRSTSNCQWDILVAPRPIDRNPMQPTSMIEEAVSVNIDTLSNAALRLDRVHSA